MPLDLHYILQIKTDFKEEKDMFLQPCIDTLLSVSTEVPAAVLESVTGQEEEDSVQFSKLSYLGCTWVKAPRNEAEAQKAMATLRAESAIPIPITLHVPNGPDGCVRSVICQKCTGVHKSETTV